MINVYGANESTFTKNGLATLRPISAEFIPQINGSWVLKCTVPFDNQLKYQYIKEQNIVQVDQACIREIGLRQLFRIYEVTKNLDSVSFIACPLGMEAVYDAPIEEIQITNKTGVQAVAALSDYLTEHGITKYTLSSDITRTATTEFENTNLIAAISGNDDNSLVNKYAGEVVYDNATIYLKNKVGLQDKARTVAYGRNLTGLKCNIDTSNMITRVYPLSNDDLRLHEYPDTEIPTGQTYIDTSDPDAPIRAAFIDTDYKLVDTTKTSNSATATKTREWQAAILDAITSKAEELWDTAIDDMSNTYCPDYIKELVNGDDGIIKYTQARYAYSHKGWQSIIKSLIKQGVEWIKEAEVPEKAWIHLDGYWYGTQNADGSRKNYARNQYIYAYSEASWYWFDNMGIMSTDAIPQETIDLLNTYTWHTDEHGQYYGDGNGHYLTNAWVENQDQTHSWVGADGYYIPEKDDASTWAWTDIDGYLYGSSVDNYAKSKYEIVNKKLEYFGSDGFWREWMTLKFADMGWFQNSDVSSPNYKKWWYGSTNRNYAHNEYVYMTVEGTMKEWWYDAEGWYDEDSSGDSDYGWHGNATDGFWFGEEDAGTEDKNKYIHDKWAFIDGTYYWFNSEGYISADATLAIPDWPWGDQISEVTGKHWFGNPDEDFNRVWVSNQWLEIDGDWYYFDSDGYMVDKKSPTITWFSDAIVNGASSVILACLTEAYNLLYTQMTDWVEKQFAEGLDKPAITIDVDMVDISNTSDYADYKDLERICLGDKVKCYGNHGIEIEARVVGLTYDLIRGYNTKVTIGQLGKSLSQILKVSYQGASEGQKLVAGDNVVIDGKVISVEDNTGAVAGLKDATLEGVSIVHGNVARLNDIYRELTQAQYNNLSSQEKNSGKLFYITDTQTIMHKNVAYGGGSISYGTSTPTGGSDKDVYFQHANSMPFRVEEGAFNGDLKLHSAKEQVYYLDIYGTPTAGGADDMYLYFKGLVTGRNYKVIIDFKFANDTHWIGRYDDWIYLEDASGTDIETIKLKDDYEIHRYELSFVGEANNRRLAFYFNNVDDGEFSRATMTIQIVGALNVDWNEPQEIIDIWQKVGSTWYSFLQEPYLAGERITIDTEKREINADAQIICGKVAPTNDIGKDGYMYIKYAEDLPDYTEVWRGSVSTSAWARPVQIGNVVPSNYLYLKVDGVEKAVAEIPVVGSSNSWNIHGQAYVYKSEDESVLWLYSSTGYTSTVTSVDGIAKQQIPTDVEAVYEKISGYWVEVTTGGGGGTEVIPNPQGTATDTLNTVEIDGTVYDLPSGGGGGGGSGYSETTLWENASGLSFNTSNQQTVTLDDGLSNYDLVAFTFGGQSASNTKATITVPVSHVIAYTEGINAVNLRGSQSYVPATRYIDDTHITFEGWASNTNCYAYKVVGIKFGGGGGSEVIPNPQGTATDTLNTVSIDGTIFDLPSGGGGGSPEVNYSTDEQKIGTWIDGKPLYRKCFSINVTLGASWTNLASIADLNIDKLIKTIPVGSFDNSDRVNLIDINGMQIRYYGNYVQGYHLTNYTVTVKDLAIEYTKTT